MKNLEVSGANTVKKRKRKRKNTYAVSVSKTKGMMSDSPKGKKLEQVG